ncbi:MAG: GntP family permease [Actinomycetota bacterium]|nr:gluconate transporter [Rubrobacter sp.]MDQ3508141.1 GntP family permease [Actinomycetota bacterium]
MSALYLLLIVVVAVALLLFLVMRLRMHAFVALLIISFATALAAGIPPGDIVGVVEDGMGGTLGFIAVVVGLGAMFGEMLRITGGAEQIARTLVRGFGEGRIQWALGLTGFLVAIPVFFDVGLIILIPLVYTLAQRASRSLLYYAIPLIAGLAVTHSFIPPTPGPVAVAGIIGADLGWVILFGIISGIPAVILGGIVFGKYIAGKIDIGVPEYMLRELAENAEEERETPSFGLTVAVVLVPLVLILINTVSGVVLAEDSQLLGILAFVGHPFSALTLAVLLAFYVLGTRHGYTRDEVQNVATRALEPVGLIILVTGAGGVFGEVLVQSGIGDALASVMEASNLPIILLAFVAATLVRIALGSATVAAVTAASIIAPALGGMDYSAPLLGAIVIAIASGATVLSHVNDSGFWLVSRYLGMNEKQTLQSWTVMETIIGLTGFSVVLVASFFL